MASTNIILRELARRHSPRRYRLLLEALAALAASAAAVRFLPFKQAVTAGAVRRPTPQRALAISAAEAGWAVRVAARLAPWRAVCIEQGIAVQRMLRRRGIDAQLHYGVRRDANDALQAHVWVMAEDAIVVGEAEAQRFTHVATFS